MFGKKSFCLYAYNSLNVELTTKMYRIKLKGRVIRYRNIIWFYLVNFSHDSYKKLFGHFRL